MAQERWDIEVLFLNGPLSMQSSIWYQGPVVRMGKKPGVDGMNLQSYQGVATIHATIQAYDGNRVVLSHIEPHAVRVATHEKVNWNQVQPIRQPVYLNQGDIVHVGSLDRGCRFKFLKCQTFEWRQSQMLSNTDQSQDQIIYNQIETRKIRASSMPPWFLPALGSSFFLGMMTILFLLIGNIKPEKPLAGPTYEGFNSDEFADITDEVPAVVLDGFHQPFSDFVMAINGETSGFTDLRDQYASWDATFYKMTLSYMTSLAKWKGFWIQLNRIHQDYSYVTNAMRQANLPEVFAGIPFTETQYQAKKVSPACAAGIWQFMPETGFRMGLKIKNCKYKGSNKGLFTPTQKAPPSPFTSAEYIDIDVANNYSCKITSCEVDERESIERSTEAAVNLLLKTWSDDTLSASGSLVQMTIMAHNAGYNDKPYLGKTKRSNILPAYKIYMKNVNVSNGIRFYGDNIKCSKDVNPLTQPADRCGGVLSNQTQHYAYKVVAQHILAVCFYAKNYSNDLTFSAWEKYNTSNGYCSLIPVPSIEELRK